MATDFTIADVLEWARTKPAGEIYNVNDASVCAAAQFGIATNRPELVGACVLGEVSEWLCDAAYTGPYTFGDFAARLEAMLPKSDWATLDAYLTDIDAVEVSA